MDDVTRRSFLAMAPAAAFIPTTIAKAQQAEASLEIPDAFPRQDPALALEIVGVSHRDVARVKELVGARPALARAAWDWGYGDWETALGAASHVGNKEIAAVLLAAGAHATIFSAAMLGQLDAVKAFVTLSPGIQRTRGPHGISLLAHARAGESVEVVTYLDALGDADPRYPNEPIAEDDVKGLLGTYIFGPGATHQLVVSRNSRRGLVVKRAGESEQILFHHGGRLFNPPGGEAVRIRFEPAVGRATVLTVVDGGVALRATR